MTFINIQGVEYAGDVSFIDLFIYLNA